MGKVKDFYFDDINDMIQDSALEPVFYTDEEIIENLWDYEKNLLTPQEVMIYCEKGFKDSLRSMSQESLRKRQSYLDSVIYNDD